MVRSDFSSIGRQEWRERARPAQLDIEIFDAPGRLNELRHAVAEMPLFDPERALLVRDPPQLTGAAKRGGADPPERLVAILGELAPTTVLCLIAHAKVADRNPVLAAVRQMGGDIVWHPAKKGREFGSGWRRRSRPGAQTRPGRIEHLIRVAGPDLGSIASELDKLVAYAGGRALSISDLRAAVAGDEAAGLYDTLGDLLGPNSGQGRRVDRPAALRRTRRPVSARHPGWPDPRSGHDAGVFSGPWLASGSRCGARQTRLAWRIA